MEDPSRLDSKWTEEGSKVCLRAPHSIKYGVHFIYYSMNICSKLSLFP